jgi:chromosome segregation ATPase
MKQLENQVKKLQHELIATKANIQQQNFNYSSNENIHMINENSTSSNHVSPNVLNCNQAISSSNASALANQIELFKTNEKFYKEKIESLKSELNAKETECEHLKTKFETCESKEKDLQHYLLLLKESITTKDQQMSMQQTEMNEMRTKIKDKEATIEKKNQHLQAIQLEKHQNESDLNEIRDQMDIKERKINVLNRKVN